MQLVAFEEVCLFIKIVNKKYSFGNVFIHKNNITKCTELYIRHCTIPTFCKCKHSYTFHLNGILLHYFIRNLEQSIFYRTSVLNKFVNAQCSCSSIIVFKLKPPKQEIIDYGWNYRMQQLVWSHCEMDYKLSWLSTLGGAFSSLGDEFQNCAVMAGKISINQMKLAKQVGDPSLVARCLLYLSLSYIQVGYFRTAKKIITVIYGNTKGKLKEDKRLKNMCIGIWTKLQYEHEKKRLLKY